MVAAKYKRVEYKGQIEDIVENNSNQIIRTNNWITQKHCRYYIFPNWRVYSLQSLDQNQWLNSDVMHVIFDHVAATRSYSRLSLQCYKARVIRISFGKSNLKFIYCRHRFSIIVCLKERLIIFLDFFYKTKKVVMFERVFFYYQWQFEKSRTKSEHYFNQTLCHTKSYTGLQMK